MKYFLVYGNLVLSLIWFIKGNTLNSILFLLLAIFIYIQEKGGKR